MMQNDNNKKQRTLGDQMHAHSSAEVNVAAQSNSAPMRDASVVKGEETSLQEHAQVVNDSAGVENSNAVDVLCTETDQNPQEDGMRADGAVSAGDNNGGKKSFKNLLQAKHFPILVIGILLIILSFAGITYKAISLCKSNSKTVFFAENIRIVSGGHSNLFFAIGDTAEILQNKFLVAGELSFDISKDSINFVDNIPPHDSISIPMVNNSDLCLIYSKEHDKTGLQFTVWEKDKPTAKKFEAVEGELLTFSNSIDTQKERPLFVVGNLTLHPEFQWNNNYKHVAIALKGHDPIFPSHFYQEDDTCYIFFGTQMPDDVKTIRILSGCGGSVLKTISASDFDSCVAFPVDASSKDSVYRIAPDGHVSVLAKAGNIRTVGCLGTPKQAKSNMGDIVLIIVLVLIIVVCVLLIIISRKTKIQPSTSDGEQSLGKSDDNKGTMSTDKTDKKGETPTSMPQPENSDLKQQINNLNTQIVNLNKQLKESRSTVSDLTNYKNAAEREILKVREDCKQAKRKVEDKAQQKIKEADRRAADAEKKADATEKRVTEKFRKQIEDLNKDINTKKQNIDNLDQLLKRTEDKLKKTETDLNVAKDENVRKDQALERFTKTITDDAPAVGYTEKVEQLLAIGEAVEKVAIKLSMADGIDDYLVNKFITRFRKAVGDVDMTTLLTDVRNTTKAQFVYKDSTLASLNQKDSRTYEESLRQYFFGTYLKKYVDALVVFNETMIGMQYLVEGVEKNDVAAFEKFRSQIDNALKDLRIVAHCVRIMDSSSDDLSLEVIPRDLEFDCPRGAICQINNSIVYLDGAKKPNEKITVIVKR